MEKTFENGVYYAPGKKVFTYFISSNILPIVIVFVVLDLGLDFLNNFLSSKKITNINSSYLIILGIIACVVAFLIAWIKYKSVEFMFDEFAFSIRKGFFAKSEISIPYRQIQFINHKQNFNEKMLGVMNVVVETAGEDESASNKKEEGILPILDTDIALSLEKELLRRSSATSPDKSRQA